jgi:bacteriorhodopsin
LLERGVCVSNFDAPLAAAHACGIVRQSKSDFLLDSLPTKRGLLYPRASDFDPKRKYDNMGDITVGQYQLVYNAFSFTSAVMGAATLFFLLGRSQVAPAYRTALTLTGIVTLIAGYHYFRIFNSWDAAFTLVNGKLALTGIAFNDAYRYVDWLLTVPLILVELILVMRLPRAETISKSVRLGLLAALMILLGYPGEIAQTDSTRWLWWGLAMVPFVIIVYELYVGLRVSIATQPESVKGLVGTARTLTIVSWCFYPVVFVFPMIGFTGGTSVAAVQIGYTVADIVAKAVFGLLIYMIAVRKSENDAADHQLGLAA